MTDLIRKHWRKISSAILLASLATVGGVKAYAYATGDCCQPGASCCYPGSPCCAHAHKAAGGQASNP